MVASPSLCFPIAAARVTITSHPLPVLAMTHPDREFDPDDNFANSFDPNYDIPGRYWYMQYTQRF